MSTSTAPTQPPLASSSTVSAVDIRRSAVGLGLAVTAAIHVLDLPGKIAETPYLAVAYALLIVVAFVLTERIFLKGSRLDYALALALALAVLVGFVVNRTVGMPGATNDIGNWLEPLGLLSLVVEAFVVWQAAAALIALRGSRLQREARPRAA